MTATLPAVPALVTPGDLGDELGSFLRHLRAGNVSPNTVYAYGRAVVAFWRSLIEHDYPSDVAAIGRRHVEEWITNLLAAYKATTAHQRYRGLRRFFSLYTTLDDDETSPRWPRMRPPRVPEYLPDVLTIGQLRALLAAHRQDLRGSPGRGAHCRRDSDVRAGPSPSVLQAQSVLHPARLQLRKGSAWEVSRPSWTRAHGKGRPGRSASRDGQGGPA